MRALTPIVILALAGAVQAQTVNLTPMSSGAAAKMGSYRPQRVTLSAEKPAAITKLPGDLAAPVFGAIPFGAAAEGKPAPQVYIVVDEPADAPARLFIDTNGNGDLTDDGAADWKGTTREIPKVARNAPPKEGEKPEMIKVTQYDGGGNVQLGAGATAVPARLKMYRFDKNDPGRAALKDTLLYYADYAYEGKLELGGKTLGVLLVDDNSTGDFRGKEITEVPGKDGKPATKTSSGVRLLIDANGNGKFERRGEDYDVRLPFNIGGTTYEISDMAAAGGSFSLVKSKQTVAEIPPPPDHSIGKTITAFNTTDTAGKPVSFPGDFKGKIVMIDFWATWCGPCMAEVPNVVKVYEEFHPQGFEILGISLDSEKSIERLEPVTKEHKMTWRQVADGKYWNAEIAEMYVIKAIPAVYLVDGDTGEILGDSSNLRGAKLKPTVEKALAAKRAKSGT